MNRQRASLKDIECDKAVFGTDNGKVIYLRRVGTKEKYREAFLITKQIGEGGSCICYEATLASENKTGRLKEFYPKECSNGGREFFLERNDDNQIIAAEKNREAFLSLREEFIKSYGQIREIMECNKNDSDFHSFIPDFSIYEACDADGNPIKGSTAYIWTAPEHIINFGKYIEEVHRRPTYQPEHKLFNILKTVICLTKCIKTIHEKGFLHLDIKPWNIGITMLDNELMEHISLFDVNSFYDIMSNDRVEYYTEGFSAPEIRRSEVDNTSDIYSIGCVVYAALINPIGYSTYDYSRISELLGGSRLLSASDDNSNIYLKQELENILKKCLAKFKSNRYQSCEELIEELEKALTCIIPAERRGRSPDGKELALVDIDKDLDNKKGSKAFLSFMYHLYKKPLFECLPMDSQELNVLLVGFGNYAQKFLDCCLQMGQLRGKKLNVTVVTNDVKRDKGIYLSSRPSITEFFSIDNSNCEDEYGSICFEESRLCENDLRRNEEFIKKLVEKGDFHYAFVALGNDDFNKDVAQAIVAETANKGISVNFIYKGEHLEGWNCGSPIYMSDDIERDELYKDIDRMAFNAHLIWKSGLNIDLESARREFEEPYNYNSSFSNVVSIKYKLYSVSIEMKDLTEAASLYYNRIVSSVTSEEIKNQLIALEHRRWICEKICAGWVCNDDLESCVEGKTNDKEAKRHVCLVRSTEDTTLSSWTTDMWDNAEKGDVETLDDLDGMSVRLHRVYKSAADRLKTKSLLADASVGQLRSLVKKKKEVGIAFSEWYNCLALILNGNNRVSKEYDKLKEVLLKAVKTLDSTSDINVAKMFIESINERFSIILKSMQYTDYKSFDNALAMYIPFILTNTNDVKLIVPFSSGSNTDMFNNVAAATVTNPSEITYVYHLSDIRKIKEFKTAVIWACNYFKEKQVRSKLNFVVTYRRDDKLREAVELMRKELFGDSGINRVQKAIFIEAESDNEAVESICKVIDTEFTCSIFEKNKTALSSRLAAKVKHPKYSFDTNKREFYGIENCEFLRYIKIGQFLKVSDMFAAKDSKDYTEASSTFYNDYIQLWKNAYRGKEAVWRDMCKLLDTYHRTADNVVTMRVMGKGAELDRFRFLIPIAAYKGATMLISEMVNERVFADRSEVNYYNTDLCEVIIYAPKADRERVKKLFSNLDIFCQYEYVKIIADRKERIVSVYYNSFKVKNVTVDNEEVKGLLKQLEEEFSFISGYEENGNEVSFSYSTKQIKRLLTDADNLLKVYLYYQCLKSGLFNDVAISYGARGEETSDELDFDIICTKGFEGLFIEAQATEGVEADVYKRLHSFTKQYGINCRPVMIADGLKVSDKENAECEAMTSRGKSGKCVTIYDAKEIDDIEFTLLRLLNVDINNEIGGGVNRILYGNIE